MKKLLNARIPVLLALALVAGIALGYLFVFFGISLFWIIAVVPVAAVFFIVALLFARKISVSVIIVAFAALIVLGGVLCTTTLNNYSTHALTDGKIYSFSATVYEKGESSGGTYIVLTNVKVDGKKADGKAIAYLSTDSGEFCDVGYKVDFTASVSTYDLFPYGKLNYNVQDNIKYSLSVSGGLSASYRFSLFGSIRAAIRNTLFYNLDSDTASIAYAMLTGNTQDVETSSMQNFRYGGISHIFAVSGLHIGIVFALLSLFLKRVRLNKFAAAAICIFCIFFYAGVCGFTLSSVRAAIMCAVSAIVGLFHKKYDSLNALSIAVVIILLISPTSLFSIGFQLSVCAVLGINLLSKQIVRPFKKLPRFLTSSVGVSLGAQLGTTPVMLAGFGYLSGAGLLLNIIIVPLLSVIFEILFVSVLLSVILPFAAPFIIPYAALPLKAVISFLVGAGFEKALITGFGAGLFCLLYFFCVLALSDKLNLKILKKAIAVGCAVCLLCTYTLLKTFYPFSDYRVTVSSYYGGGQILIKGGGGNVLVITEGLYSSQTQKFLNECYATNLSAVIILGSENCVNSYSDFNLDCGDVYVFDEYFQLSPYDSVAVHYEKVFTLHGATYAFYDGYSIIVACDGVNVGICAGEVRFDCCDLLLTAKADEDCVCDSSVCFKGGHADYDLYRTGALTFSLKDEKITLIGIARK